MASPESIVETSDPETQSQITIEPQELKPEQIKQLIELAQKEGETEARFILVLEEWRRQGESYEDKAEFSVIFGEADIVKIEDIDEGYPYRRISKYLVIPKTVPTIVLWHSKWDYDLDRGESMVVYVFTSEGWKSISVK